MYWTKCCVPRQVNGTVMLSAEPLLGVLLLLLLVCRIPNMLSGNHYYVDVVNSQCGNPSCSLLALQAYLVRPAWFAWNGAVR